MYIERISILNFKNIADATLEFSPRVNCFLGLNGMGKSNLLEAIYFLSFVRSFGQPMDWSLASIRARMPISFRRISRSPAASMTPSLCWATGMTMA